MSEEVFFDITREGLWVATVISTPILAVALISGMLVGLFQALTSIQEMTLTFVPKLLCIVLTFWVSMSFMSKSLETYFRDQIIPMIREG